MIDGFNWPEDTIVNEMMEVANLLCDLAETFRDPKYALGSPDNLGSDLYRLYASCRTSAFLKEHKKVFSIQAIVDEVRFSWKFHESVT